MIYIYKKSKYYGSTCDRTLKLTDLDRNEKVLRGERKNYNKLMDKYSRLQIKTKRDGSCRYLHHILSEPR